MAVLIDIVKVAEDDLRAAYSYAKVGAGPATRPGLILIDKRSGTMEPVIRSSSDSDIRDGIDAQAAMHKLRKALSETGGLPQALTYAA